MKGEEQQEPQPPTTMPFEPEHPKPPTKGFRGLIAWQKGMQLAVTIYEATRPFPKDELYGITSQMRRAAVSIPSNLAEGQLRQSRKELSQFISISLGSCAELSTQLEISKRLNYITDTTFTQLSQQIDQVMKLLHGLRRKLSSSP